jgi:hypothetical protein
MRKTRLENMRTPHKDTFPHKHIYGSERIWSNVTSIRTTILKTYDT